MNPSPSGKIKTVLVAPLDWGLGHASRCIPIIQVLMDEGAEVILAGSGRSMDLLRLEFPSLKMIKIPGFSPKLSGRRSQVLRLIAAIPSFLFSILAEHYALRKILRNTAVDIVISDNRFGIRSNKTRSVMITHQLFLRFPRSLGIIGIIAQSINRQLLKAFDEIWIPDDPGINNLSGALSHNSGMPGNAKFIGPVSRFSGLASSSDGQKDIDVLVVISGPEPQRQWFQDIITEQLQKNAYRCVIVTGEPDKPLALKQDSGIIFYHHLGKNELSALIRRSSLVICRPGYSTIMDLHYLGGKALFIPTPGQTEQEYLGKLFCDRGLAFCTGQDKTNLELQVPQALKYKGFSIAGKQDILLPVIRKVLFS